MKGWKPPRDPKHPSSVYPSIFPGLVELPSDCVGSGGGEVADTVARVTVRVRLGASVGSRLVGRPPLVVALDVALGNSIDDEAVVFGKVVLGNVVLGNVVFGKMGMVVFGKSGPTLGDTTYTSM